MIRSIEFRAMNTSIQLAGEGERTVEGMFATKALIDESEQRFSRFLPASELTELNRSAGDWTQVSGDLFDMLQLSQKYHAETNGLFDPAVLPDLKRAGYDRSMDEIHARGEMPLPEAAGRARRPPFSEMSLDPEGGRVLLPHGMEIDLGGVAKAWIVERAARLLHTYAEVCAVSAGGDILFIGRPEDGLDWDVYLEDPRNPTESIAQLHIAGGAVATSSVMKRTWLQGGRSRHHLIDPRTGEPAETDWLSVTVICPDIITAEVYAKAILIAGESGLPSLLRAKPEIAFIAVDPEGNLLGSPDYKDFIYEFTTDAFAPSGIAG